MKRGGLMKLTANSFKGRWKIVRVEMWDQDFVGEEVPGHVTLGDKGLGDFQFGYVHGSFTWSAKNNRIDALWEGNDEMDPAHGPIPCAPFPNQSALIQHAYDGCAVAISPDFDPSIFDPASDIGVLFSEAITRGVLRFGGLFGCWWRRIDQMKTKGNRMFAK